MKYCFNKLGVRKLRVEELEVVVLSTDPLDMIQGLLHLARWRQSNSRVTNWNGTFDQVAGAVPQPPPRHGSIGTIL